MHEYVMKLVKRVCVCVCVCARLLLIFLCCSVFVSAFLWERHHPPPLNNAHGGDLRSWTRHFCALLGGGDGVPKEKQRQTQNNKEISTTNARTHTHTHTRALYVYRQNEYRDAKSSSDVWTCILLISRILLLNSFLSSVPFLEKNSRAV
jgi:hypothetical protein